MEPPADFDPSDPALWKHGFHAHNAELEPTRDLKKMGFSRHDLAALIWLRNLRNTVSILGLSLFITVDGRHRSGKSRFFATVGALFSNAFEKNMDKYIISDADGLLNIVEHIDTNKIKDPVLIVDEAGSALNSADWYERIQKAIIKTLTIIGYLHPTIIFIAPIKDLVLSGIRKMSHVHVKITRNRNEYATIIPYEVHYNSLKGKPYYKKFRIVMFGQPLKIDAIRATLPPKHIDDMYAAIEATRKPVMLKDIRSDAMKAEIKQKRDVIDFDEISDFVVKNFEFFKTDRSKPDQRRVDSNMIRAKFRIPVRDADTIKRFAEKKLNGGVMDVQESQDGKGE